MLCLIVHNRSEKNSLHSFDGYCRRSQGLGIGMLLLLIAALVMVESADASACGTVILSSSQEGQSVPQDPATVRALDRQHPQIIRSGFMVGGGDASASRDITASLWLEIRNSPASVRGVLLEPVWGSGPDSLSQMWGRVHPLFDGLVQVAPNQVGRYRDQPFTLGVRARFVLQDGSLSAPSLPVFIHHAGSAEHTDGVGADSVFMVLCLVALFGLWVAFKRENNPVFRIRIAAGAALVSLFFLSVTPALSWQVVNDSSGYAPSVDCHLGDEAQCATYVPDSGPNPMSRSDVAAERRFELASWMGASSALRVGMVWCLILLLPALIWLMVVPTLRPAQTAVAFGASAAGYTFLAALFYRLCTPSWMDLDLTCAFDLTLLTSGTIFMAIGTIIRYSLLIESRSRSPLPPAIARRM